MVLEDFPFIEELDSDYHSSKKIYQVGYILGEFIVENWGMDSLIDLIKSNGNIQKDLGVSVDIFVQNWYQYVKDKYLSKN